MGDFIEDAMDEVKDDAEDTVQKTKQACCCCMMGWILFPLALYLLFQNEKHYVCETGRLDKVGADAKTGVCGVTTGYKQKDLLFVSGCAIDVSATVPFTPASIGLGNTGLKSAFSHKAVGMQSEVKMFQCKETTYTVTSRRLEEDDGEEGNRDLLQDRKGETGTDGFLEDSSPERNLKSHKTKTKTMYKYELGYYTQQFTISPPNSQAQTAFAGAPCYGKPNPTLGSLIELGTKHDRSDDVKVGGWTLSKSLNGWIGIADAPYTPPGTYASTTAGLNRKVGDATAPLTTIDASTMGLVGTSLKSCTTDAVGCLQIDFATNKATTATVLSGVGSGSTLEPWIASGSTFLCGESKTEHLWADAALTLEGVVTKMHSAADSQLKIFRILLILGTMLTWYMILYPIYAAADIAGDWLDNIPCCGDCLEDILEGAASCIVITVAILVGGIFACLTISISWLLMRPLYGVISLAVAGLCIGILFYLKSQTKPSQKRLQRKVKKGEISEEEAMEMKNQGDSDADE